MNLVLRRSEQLGDGTFGVLWPVDDAFPGPPLVSLQTIEDDWKDNAPRESCIPDGVYTLQRTMYYKGGYETFEVTGVPGRSRILIHKANTEEDIEGCIGVGMRRGTLTVSKDEDTGALRVRKQAIVGSAEAFGVFMGWLAEVDEAALTIEWATGLPRAAA